jgi:membrane associated rhomboid family serine protease
MFPLRDENPTELTPYVTMAFIAINFVVWIVVQGMGTGQVFLDSVCAYGSIPGELTGSIPDGTHIDLGGVDCRVGGLGWQTVVTSMFMHGGWVHLVGNLWFLWVFGNNIEDSMGHGRFVVFYLLTGALAAGAHVVTNPSSAIPVVGASGAISGVMGAYLVLYPKVRVQTLIFLIVFFKVLPIPASAMLAYWFFLQLAYGVTSLELGGGGVAFWAHIGGFVAGVALIRPFERRRLVEAKLAGRQLSPEEVRDLGWF